MSSPGNAHGTDGWLSCFTHVAARALWLITLTLVVSGGHIGGREGSAFCVTSMVAMKSLISQEGKLISHLGKLLDLAAADDASYYGPRVRHLRRHLDCIYQSHEAVKASGPISNDPISGFRLIRRLIQDWSHVAKQNQSEQALNSEDRLQANLKSMEEVISHWQLWPKDFDEQGAALALIRIGRTYQMYPTIRVQKNNLDTPHWQRTIIPMSFKNVLHDHDLTFSSTSIYSRGSQNNSPSCDPDQRSTSKLPTGNIKENSRTCKNDLQPEHNHGLSIDDFIFVTKTAIAHGYMSEAIQWYWLMFEFFNSTTNKPVGVETEIMKLRNKLRAKEDAELKKGLPKDEVADNYIKLCRKSIQHSSYRTSSSSLQCSWKQIWPYVRHKTELLHQSPDVYIFYDVISNTEIEHIKSQAYGRLLPSLLDDSALPANTSILGWRTSHTAWLGDQTNTVKAISQRVGQVTGLLTTSVHVDTPAEPFQVVNYGLGGMYGPHLDTLYSSRHGATNNKNNNNKNSILSREDGDRLATWMFYLSDVKLGGATVFPLLDLGIKPVKGSAALWYNLHANGRPDRLMVHAGCPVVEGDKWVANKWIREISQWNKRPCDLRPWM